MQCTGNSRCFLEGKRAAIVRRYPLLFACFFVVLCAVFHVSVMQQTLALTTYSLTCARDLSYACVYTHGGWAHRRVITTCLTRKNSHKLFSCSGRGSNLWSWNPLDLEADALPIEPHRHLSIFLRSYSLPRPRKHTEWD